MNIQTILMILGILFCIEKFGKVSKFLLEHVKPVTNNYNFPSDDEKTRLSQKFVQSREHLRIEEHAGHDDD